MKTSMPLSPSRTSITVAASRGTRVFGSLIRAPSPRSDSIDGGLASVPVNAKARLRRTAGAVLRAVHLRSRPPAPELALYGLRVDRFLTYAYNALFRRDPDPSGTATYR